MNATDWQAVLLKYMTLVYERDHIMASPDPLIAAGGQEPPLDVPEAAREWLSQRYNDLLKADGMGRP